MQKNYVLQVLLVTLGFGVLLGLIAVVDVPRDWSQEPTAAAMPPQRHASGDMTRSGQMANQATTGYVMSPRVVDFDDRPDSPLRDATDEGQPLPWQHCHKADPAHNKACEDTGHPARAGKIAHC